MLADQPQAAAAPSGGIAVDARRRQLIGVTTARVQRQRLRPAIRAAGQVTYDERRLTDVALKFDGWVGKLHANYVGAAVRQGEILLTVYSPELVSAQEEYLDTLRRRKTGSATLSAAARRRLARWNMGTTEIWALESRGAGSDYVSIRAPASGTVIEKNIVAGTAVKAGDTLMRIADLTTVWVEAQVYEYEVSLVRIGMAAEITLPSLPGRIFQGRVSYIYPALDGPTRTAQAYTQVQLTADLGERLLVPDSAVIYAGATRVVFVDLGQGYLEPRKVSIGHRTEDAIEVLEGLSEGEVVVTSGNFLIAAESKLKAGIDQW
ncbi:MAG: efflux RND transporter periplasmic adaptor subunit, partial [Geminicoccales bacterium]